MARPLFRYPYDGTYPVSSPFGPRGGGMHTGTDFSIPSGVRILAANDGRVIYAAYEAGGAGNTVTIEGADGWQSRYHHMERWTVTVGQQVTAGTQVGVCNNTGASSGPHLHFEIRSNASTPVDPIPILEADAGHTGEMFTVGQMEDIAQWHHDTRNVILNELVGDQPPGTEAVLAGWSNDTRAYIDKQIKESEQRIIAAINANR